MRLNRDWHARRDQDQLAMTVAKMRLNYQSKAWIDGLNKNFTPRSKHLWLWLLHSPRGIIYKFSVRFGALLFVLLWDLTIPPFLPSWCPVAWSRPSQASLLRLYNLRLKKQVVFLFPMTQKWPTTFNLSSSISFQFQDRYKEFPEGSWSFVSASQDLMTMSRMIYLHPLRGKVVSRVMRGRNFDSCGSGFCPLVLSLSEPLFSHLKKCRLWEPPLRTVDGRRKADRAHLEQPWTGDPRRRERGEVRRHLSFPSFLSASLHPFPSQPLFSQADKPRLHTMPSQEMSWLTSIPCL